MEKIRFGIIGGGWRSRFYVTIARQMPERFGVTGVLLRDGEKAQAYAAQTGVKTFTSFDQFMAASPEFVVLSVHRSAAPEYLHLLMKMGVPVLCETPPAWSVPELEELWKEYTQRGAKVQVAEQYFARPMIAAKLEAISLGMLGEVSYAEQSICHGYHGVNLLRRFLGIGFEDCVVRGQRFLIPATQTRTRDGELSPEQYIVGSAKRDLCTFSFSNGKTGVYNFSSEQYRSFIRRSGVQILGHRGEINDDEIFWLSQDGVPSAGRFQRYDYGVGYDHDGFCPRSVTLGELELYRNPFIPARMGDEEIAIADCLVGMYEYAKGRAEAFYPLPEALQDTYLAICMGNALETGEPVVTQPMVWH
ncbi:MAG: Gfo/Idh/MocA family oxidoreductase [Oscillospiraceae bacterium]|jgi:hypothetical protein|nr:Gfo/Idh/MocA family oxidoreductase [Oscillospiraceae bacterium]